MVQPIEKPGLVDTFICNCTDCREYVRGKELLTKFAQSKTIESGNVMENHFCSRCGTLMYRYGHAFPGKLIPRIGTIDDFDLQETKLKPRIEQFCRDRVAWLGGGKGVQQEDGSYFKG